MNIKLLICYHKPSTLFQDDILTPIHVGRALAKTKMKPDDENLNWLLNNMIGDDTGENISLKNGSYNEMSSLYWAWKNYGQLGNPDFIGLMHYRRHFIFRESEIKVYETDTMGPHYLEKLNYSPQKLAALLEDCDFACHLGKVDSVYKHYLDNHKREDLDLAVQILKEKYPDYSETADAYLKQDISNFCNMFLFPKNLFFDYCEWIFSILETFENTVDVSEKRFFISERLTGIYIHHLIQKGFKYKVFPISFVAEPMSIPIAMPLNQQNLFPLATTILSILKNAHTTTSYSFYLLDQHTISPEIEDKFKEIKRRFPKVSFHFVKMQYDSEYYPIELSERLPNLNKCIYLTDKLLVMQDLSEFFRTCSVDDYYICGLPLCSYDVYASNKAIETNALMIHTARFRKYQLLEKSLTAMEQKQPAEQIINQICEQEIGYFPYWFTTFSDSLPNQNIFPDKNKSRSEYQREALYRPFLYYTDILPWIDSQGVYSNFWWNMARFVPHCFDFVDIDLKEVEALYAKQQQEINHIHQYLQSEPPALPQQTTQSQIAATTADDDWAKASLWTKAKAYCKLFGFRKAVKRTFEKLFGGN